MLRRTVLALAVLALLGTAHAVSAAPYPVGPNPVGPWLSWGYQVDYQTRANWLAVNIPWGTEAAMSGNYVILEDFLFRVDPSTSGLADPSTVYGQAFWKHDGIYGLGEFFEAGLGTNDRYYVLELSLGATDTWKVFYEDPRDVAYLFDFTTGEHYIFEGTVSSYYNRDGYFYGVLTEDDGKYNGVFTAAVSDGTPDIMDPVFHAGKDDPGRTIYVATTGSDVTGDGSQANPYATIQKAVDQSGAGDTIYVAAGTYTGTINIEGRSDITVIGEDRDTVIVKPSSLLNWDVGGYGSSRKAAVRIVSSTGIDFSSITFDFDTVKGNNVVGVFYWDSTGVVNDNVLKNMSLPDTSGGYYEIGSYVRAPSFSDASRAAVTFSNNSFVNTGRVGIVVHDFVQMNVIGNSFEKTIDDFGYAVEMGSRSTGVISGNTISGYDTPAASDGSASAALYIENCFTGGLPHVNKPVVVSDNTITGNQFGICIGNEYSGYAGDVDIRVILLNNTITGNTDAGVFVADEDRSAGSSVLLNASGNIVQNNGDVGYWFWTYNDGSLTARLSGETISGHGVGVDVGIDTTTGAGSVYDLSARFSSITDNSTWGIDVDSAVGATFDAVLNWWGDAGGPGSGGANGVDGSVDWSPALASAPSAGQLVIKHATDPVIYRQFNQPVALELWQQNLPSAAAAYQAFLGFDTALLGFTSGTYTSSPYGWPVLSPIAASGTEIDLAAGILPPGQSPSAADAKLADLSFTTGTSEGVTEVAFRATNPMSRFSDSNGDEIATVTLNGPPIVIDNTAPVITCPGDKSQSNDAGLCSATVAVGTATAVDNLSGVASVVGTRSDILPLTDPYPVGATTITWVATDNSGNSSSCVQSVTVTDDEDPTITAPSDVSVNTDPGVCYATGVALGTPTTGDNCGVASVTNDAPSQFPKGDTTVTWTVTDIHGNTATDTQTVTVTDAEPPVVTAGTIASCYATEDDAEAAAIAATTATDNCTAPGSLVKTASTVGDCSAVITVRVTDEASNYAEVTYNTRIDNTAPVITGPRDITVYAAPNSQCTTVTWTAPTANDNCDGAVAVTCDHSSGECFANGTTTKVTCTATDTCGNVGTHEFNVTVLNTVQAEIQVELESVVAGPISRCIDFTFGGSGGANPPVTKRVMVTLTNGVGTAYIDDVPAGVNYTCITAKDKLHTLRSQVALGTSGGKYVASFTGADKLTGGDLTNDNLVDILDFGTFAGQCGLSKPAADCSYVGRHADISGDTQVGTDDFSFIQLHFLTFGDGACAGTADAEPSMGPRTSVTVEELAKSIGRRLAYNADLNKDGVIDLVDVALWTRKLHAR